MPTKVSTFYFLELCSVVLLETVKLGYYFRKDCKRDFKAVLKALSEMTPKISWMKKYVFHCTDYCFFNRTNYDFMYCLYYHHHKIKQKWLPSMFDPTYHPHLSF